MSRPFLLAVLLFLLTGAGYTEKTGFQQEIYICRAMDGARVEPDYRRSGE